MYVFTSKTVDQYTSNVFDNSDPFPYYYMDEDYTNCSLTENNEEDIKDQRTHCGVLRRHFDTFRNRFAQLKSQGQGASSGTHTSLGPRAENALIAILQLPERFCVSLVPRFGQNGQPPATARRRQVFPQALLRFQSPEITERLTVKDDSRRPLLSLLDIPPPPPLIQQVRDSAEPLYQVKLLAALRSGDPALIHPFLTDAVALPLSHRSISSSKIYTDTTPLHLATSLGRVDQRACKEVAKGKDVLRAIADSRSLLNTYIHSPPTAPPNLAFLALLDFTRMRFVNLYLDNAMGSSLLHKAAKRKNLQLIKLPVRAGADVFVRDRSGQMAYDGVPKDDRVCVFLRQFAYHDPTPIDAPISESRQH
ncbi:hypothetical protein PLICRDRAFT_177611 [Plicaturopsis crispa FD-325 SS-3]|nr:hypothetical protein PLICRDRAFT_177611 [Plicaturopsis crispa FD-325 SS-3]